MVLEGRRDSTRSWAAVNPINLFRSFDNFDHAPALEFAQGAGFHDAHQIADIAIVVFIMRHEFLGLFNELAVDRVHQLTFHRDGDGFFHFIAGNYPDSCFS